MINIISLQISQIDLLGLRVVETEAKPLARSRIKTKDDHSLGKGDAFVKTTHRVENNSLAKARGISCEKEIPRKTEKEKQGIRVGGKKKQDSAATHALNPESSTPQQQGTHDRQKGCKRRYAKTFRHQHS